MENRLGTEPRECDCVFLKKPNWIKLYNVNNSEKIACPTCKTLLGIVKLSGLKCLCGHWSVPGYSIMRKHVKVKES